MKLKYLALSVCAAALMSCNSDKPVAADPTLTNILGDKFLVGVAINSEQAAGRDTSAVDVVRRHFNSIVAENCMKSEVIHPKKTDMTLARQTNSLSSARITECSSSGIARWAFPALTLVLRRRRRKKCFTRSPERATEKPYSYYRGPIQRSH